MDYSLPKDAYPITYIYHFHFTKQLPSIKIEVDNIVAFHVDWETQEFFYNELLGLGAFYEFYSLYNYNELEIYVFLNYLYKKEKKYNKFNVPYNINLLTSLFFIFMHFFIRLGPQKRIDITEKIKIKINYSPSNCWQL